MKKSFLLICSLFVATVFSQEQLTQRVWRVNFLNPGIEYEMPIGNNSTLSIGVGIGYSGSYPHSSASGVDTGLVYAINPFLDLQQRWFYNFDKRKTKGLNITNNSANFISARILTRGKTLFGDDVVTDNLDFAVGPTWVSNVDMVKTFTFYLIWDLFIILM